MKRHRKMGSQEQEIGYINNVTFVYKHKGKYLNLITFVCLFLAFLWVNFDYKNLLKTRIYERISEKSSRLFCFFLTFVLFWTLFE